jgi:3-phenylpropionate/cinnamic acid dioxygenase small subunit
MPSWSGGTEGAITHIEDAMTTLEALEAEVRRLTQCQAAASILHTYAASLDEPDVATVLRLFRDDAVLETPNSTAAGHEEIGAFFRRAWAADPSVKRHFITSPRVTWLEPGLVRLEAYFYFIGRASQQSVLGWGTYDDTVDVTGPEPRFARMRIDSHLRTDLVAGWPAPLVDLT